MFIVRALCAVLLSAFVAGAIPAVAQDKPVARDKLVAIDVLLVPGERMIKAAEEWNKRLREQMPDGFSFDGTHRPHISLLQQYVEEKDVPAVIAAIKSIAASENVDRMDLEAIGLYHIPSGDIGLQGITVFPSDDILALQANVIRALATFRRSGGGQAAFVPDPDGKPFDPALFSYVDTFAEKQSGGHFRPHVTTGIGPLNWVEAREHEPFWSFKFGVDGIAVYRMGNFGTAAKWLGD